MIAAGPDPNFKLGASINQKCSSPEKTDTKNCLRCDISDWLRRLYYVQGRIPA